MAEENIVYLDHLIPRENLRYRRSDEYYNTLPDIKKLTLVELLDSNPVNKLAAIKKPDFQRATWSWTPEDCVLLLESLIHDQVIPSIIMWLSSEIDYYILDGGHRVSVVLAWIKDNWGDGDTLKLIANEDSRNRVVKSANAVRNLVKSTIGSFENYRKADKEYNEASQRGENPKNVLKDITHLGHPFCVENKDIISRIMKREKQIELAPLSNSGQLTFFDLDDFDLGLRIVK